jgi:bisphosphoglycerate-dependent phosphoglycerate mutase
MIEIPVSVGELLDKIAILKIKIREFADPVKKENCLREYRLLLKIAEENEVFFPEESEELVKINERLWAIENGIRRRALEKRFDEEFVELARRSFQTNEERAKLKKRINRKANSAIMEEKEYTGYADPE